MSVEGPSRIPRGEKRSAGPELIGQALLIPGALFFILRLRELPPAHAHHLMVEAIKSNVLPASRLPKILEAWEEPKHEEFTPRTAWSLFNAFTEVQKSACPWAQMDGSLKLSSLFRRELQLS